MFKTQTVYKKNASFKIAMRELEKVGAVKAARLGLYPFSNCYSLTANGRAFVEKVLML